MERKRSGEGGKEEKKREEGERERRDKGQGRTGEGRRGEERRGEGRRGQEGGRSDSLGRCGTTSPAPVQKVEQLT